MSAWARCQSAGAGTQCPGRERAGGRASASENSLTQQLGKWVCSPAPQINRFCSLRSAAGSARREGARRSGDLQGSGTGTPCPCTKPSPDPPGRSTAGLVHLGREYPPHRIHTCGGPRRCWIQAPWSHQAPPTLERLWRSQSGLWLLVAEKAVCSGVWGARGPRKSILEEVRQSSALSLADPERSVSLPVCPPPFKTTGALKISSREGRGGREKQVARPSEA